MLLLVIFILTIAAAQSPPQPTDNSQQNYYISPSLPPTAFVGQYYTVQFRVIGLDNPSFTFASLPPPLIGYPNGTLQGLPSLKGSFSVKISFQSPPYKSQSELVLRVLDPLSIDATTVLGSRKLAIINPGGLLTYSAGLLVNLSFRAQNGKQPYIWTFTNLPAGLIANMQGSVNGSFIQEGYYTFSVTVADSTGLTTDSYITVNVQPLSAGKDLIEVPNRNTAVQYDLQQIQQNQLSATKAVYAAIGRVYELQNETNAKREMVAQTTTVLALAEQQERDSRDLKEKRSTIKDLAELLMTKAREVVKALTNVVELAKTNMKNVGDMAYSAIKTATEAGRSFKNAQKQFNLSSAAFIKAQSQSMSSVATLKQAITTNSDAYSVYNLTYESYKQGKEILQEQLDKKVKADMIVDLAANQRSIANTVNDNAQAELTIANDKYVKGIAAFNRSLAAASQILAERNEDERLLGIAKMNYQQSMNNLFVAQARKEQADKATSIVSMQSATLPQQPGVNVASSYVFEGCDPKAYPFVSGSSFVKQANKLGLRVVSGQIIVFGVCTEFQPGIQSGDLIEFQGYLSNGFVQATLISKVRV